MEGHVEFGGGESSVVGFDDGFFLVSVVVVVVIVIIIMPFVSMAPSRTPLPIIVAFRTRS